MRRPRYRARPSAAGNRSGSPRRAGHGRSADRKNCTTCSSRAASARLGEWCDVEQAFQERFVREVRQQCAVPGDQQLAGVLGREDAGGHLTFEVVGGEVEHRAEHAGEVDREVLAAVDRLATDHPDVVRVVGEEPEARPKHQFDLVPATLRCSDRRGEPVEPVAQEQLEHLLVQRLLRRRSGAADSGGGYRHRLRCR